MSAQSVSTHEYRVKFVKKTSAEVGDGTEFPMLISLKQLAEVLYRVKDAWFTAGEIKFDHLFNTMDEPSYTLVGVGAGTPPTTLMSAGGCDNDPNSFWESRRGYMYASSQELTGSSTSYFGADYGSSFSDIYAPYYVYDCSDNERVMWTEQMAAPIKPQSGVSGLRTAFHHSSIVEDASDYFLATGILSLDADYIFYTWEREFGTEEGLFDFYRDNNATLDIFQEVAWVNSDPLVTDPFNSSNNYYLKLDFSINKASNEYFWELYYLTTNSGSFVQGPYAALPPQPTTIANLIIQLNPSEQLTCPIYYDYILATLDGAGAILAIDVTKNSDFIIEAKKWWPYVKLDTGTNLPAPIWNENDGTKL